MRLLCVLYANVCLGLNIHFFFRTAHPDVPFHQKRLAAAKADLKRQVDELKLSESIHFESLFDANIHSKEEYYQDFLIMNALPYVQEKISSDVDWIFFGEETTHVVLDRLIETLEGEKHGDKAAIIGRGLYDREPAIIHHFFGVGGDSNYKTFAFPDFDAGFVINQPLLNQIIDKLAIWKSKPEFQIDPKHEFIKFIKTHLNIEMQTSKHFCGGNWHREQKTCFTRAGKELPDCGLTDTSKIFVAVKTTEKFHADRLKVVKKTWGPKFDNIKYYSNVTDPKIPTVVSGPNTERGHCQKLYHILEKFHEMEGYEWLYVADDDTIVSAYRLHRLTACYDGNQPLFIGERYGYGLNTGHGYPYVTGGGGMLFSRGAVKAWKSHNCHCPTADSPDDMMIGMCLTRAASIVHLNNFHQARPDDYSEGYLDNNTPLSFHKHWNNDPLQVYANWFGLDDTQWWSTQAHDHPSKKTEL